MNTYSKQFTQMIADVTFDALSEEAIQTAKKSILDTLGIMFPATTLSESSSVFAGLFAELNSGDECVLIGYGKKASLLNAMMVNGSLTHAADFDDFAGIDKPIVHPTAGCFPAVITLAEYLGGISGKDFITAITIGDEVGIRMGSCPKGNVLWDYPFFSSTIFGAFQASAASAKLLGLTQEQISSAFGIALNRVGGIQEGLFDYDYRSVRDAYGNTEGVLCSLLAKRGINGCDNSLELLYKTYYNDNVDYSYITDGLGEDFIMAKLIGYKPWPSCQGTHAYIQACLEVMKENDIKAGDIAHIVLHGHAKGESMFVPREEKSRPQSSITAKTAIPFVVGLAACKGSVVLSDFKPENLEKPEVIAMAEKMDFIRDDSYGSNGARIDIETSDGSVYTGEVRVLRGSVGNPMSMEELVEKFKSCTKLAKSPLSENTVDKIVDLILNLEEVEDVREITSLLMP